MCYLNDKQSLASVHLVKDKIGALRLNDVQLFFNISRRSHNIASEKDAEIILISTSESLFYFYLLKIYFILF